MSQNITYKPSQAVIALKTAISIKRPVFLWGPPGIGKSQLVAEIAESMGLELRDVRATLLDPVDLRGLPKVEGGMTQWMAPAFLPRTGKGILFLDELNASPQSVQVSCYQLILDRRLGEYTLPEGWTVLAAGNRLIDSAAASRMSSALANRFLHFELQADVEDWIAWGLKNEINPELLGFIKFRPEFLHKFNRDDYAFPSPRSWEFASQLLATKPSKDMELALLASCVGVGAATEFISYIRLYRELPDIEELVKNPDKVKVPTEAGTRYALAFALSVHANEKNFAQVASFLERMPAEFGVLAMKSATQRNPKLVDVVDPKTKQGIFLGWVTKHKGLF